MLNRKDLSMNEGNDIWLKKLAVGDDNAFRQLFEEYYTPLVLFADSYINNTEQARDTVQDIFLTLCSNKEKFSSIDKLKAYLYCAVKNKCLKQLRHEKVKDKYASHIIHTTEGDVSFWDRVLEEEVYRLLYKSIINLPNQTQKVYLLSLKGYKNQEIAEELEIAVETVKSHKKTGKQLLQKQMKGLLSIMWIVSF